MLHRNIAIPIILCAGSGTRLWPLSRKRLPQQFVPLANGKRLQQLTAERVAQLSPQARNTPAATP